MNNNKSHKSMPASSFSKVLPNRRITRQNSKYKPSCNTLNSILNGSEGDQIRHEDYNRNNCKKKVQALNKILKI